MKFLQLFEKFIQTTTNIYHSTDLTALYAILFQNRLAGTTPQEIDGVMVRGVSCTRDKNFIYKGYDITLELDINSISKKWKIYDVDFFKTDFGKSKMSKHSLKNEDEKESFIITGDINSEHSIKPLSKYLVSIHLNKKGMSLPEDIKEILEMSFHKVKIYNSDNKDITKTIIKNKVGIGFDSDDFIGGFNDFM